MTVAVRTRLGAYEILTLVGEGGMGQVYRARDRKLVRAVAIKIPPDAFVRDHERVARFKREAKAVETDNDSVETRVQPFDQRHQPQPAATVLREPSASHYSCLSSRMDCSC
jgi:serine/threonine protein kinase